MARGDSSKSGILCSRAIQLKNWWLTFRRLSGLRKIGELAVRGHFCSGERRRGRSRRRHDRGRPGNPRGSAARRFLPEVWRRRWWPILTDNPSVEVCISATPPLAQKHARYMIKRLTTAVPAATLLTALWGASDERMRACKRSPRFPWWPPPGRRSQKSGEESLFRISRSLRRCSED